MGSPILNPVMTLGEYSKGPDIPEEARPLIEEFAKSSDVMEILPFENLSGFSYMGYRQVALPAGMAFRAINAPSTSGASTLAAFQEATYLIDHDIPVDRAMVDRGGDRRRAFEEIGGMAELGQLFITNFIKGDNTTNNTVFNGLQKRSALMGRVIDNSGGVSGGAPLSLAQLDLAIQNVANPTHIVVPWAIKYRFLQAARNVNVAGFVIKNEKEPFGSYSGADGPGGSTNNAAGGGNSRGPFMTYQGLPLLFGYQKTLNPPILPFTEVAAGGGSATTASIYVIAVGENRLCGIQNAPIEIRDFGLLQDGITYNTHFHWDVGLVDNDYFCFMRLSGIQQAAITV
jgi:hypothetical protein